MPHPAHRQSQHDGDDVRQRGEELVDVVVRGVLDIAPPRFVIAKGGITSSDVASRGLEIGRAIVRGPMKLQPQPKIWLRLYSLMVFSVTGVWLS